MAVRGPVLFLFLGSLASAQSGPIWINPSTEQVQLGQSFSIQVSGPSCQPQTDWSGCYDWIAAYPYGACNGTTSVGTNTCYYSGRWNWLSSIGTADGSEVAAVWNDFAFDSPGEYQFRVSYCGCCNTIHRWCSSYQQYGSSSLIKVPPPFHIDQRSPGVQFVLGLLYVEFEKVDNLESLLTLPSGGESCTGCICNAEHVYESFRDTFRDFDATFQHFNMEKLKHVLEDIAHAIRYSENAMTSCHIDRLMGKPITKDLLDAAAAMVTGLGEVEEAVKMVIYGQSVYTDVANIVENFRLKNYFGTGVHSGRLVNTVLAAAKDSWRRQSDVSECRLRHPGGVWTDCNCSRPFDFTRYPGNQCRNITKLRRQSEAAASNLYTSPDNSSKEGWYDSVPFIVAVSAVGVVIVVLGSLMAYRYHKRTQHVDLDAQSAVITTSDPLLEHDFLAPLEESSRSMLRPESSKH